MENLFFLKTSNGMRLLYCVCLRTFPISGRRRADKMREKVNWLATWRLWCRREAKRKEPTLSKIEEAMIKGRMTLS